MCDSIESKVKTVIARHFSIPPARLRMDAAFVDDLGADALDLIELGYQIEAAFDLSLSRPERDSLVTTRDVVTCLNRRGR